MSCEYDCRSRCCCAGGGFCPYCGYLCDCTNNKAIRKALEILIRKDKYLLENNLNERSITHKLAEHLQRILPNYDIDCEWNKKLDDKKMVDFEKLIKAIRQKLSFDGFAKNDSLGNILRPLLRELEEPERFGTDDLEGGEKFIALSAGNKKYIEQVFPDIIAHHRGTMNNKIVIEAKKEKNRDKKARLFDLAKLAALTDRGGDYKYDVGYFVDLPNTMPDKICIEIEPASEIEEITTNSNVYTVKVKNRI